MIKNIVFDIGNVLVKFGWREHFTSFGYGEEMVNRLAKATVQSEKWDEYDRGVLSENEILAGFVENDPELEPVILQCLKNINGMLRRFDYTIPWVKALKEKGYGVFYLSNMSSYACRDCKEDLAFLDHMDGGILSWKERIIKPNPVIYRLLLDRYGLKPEECVFLDDTEKNIVAARKEGMKGILFRNKEQACTELRELGIDA